MSPRRRRARAPEPTEGYPWAGDPQASAEAGDVRAWPSRGKWAGSRTRSATIDCLLLALAVAAVAVSLLGVIGTPRLLLVLAAGCLVPGAALLTQLVSEDLLSAFALAIGLSLGIEATGALAMVWTGWWHPSGFALAVLALSCIALSWDALCALRPANGSEG